MRTKEIIEKEKNVLQTEYDELKRKEELASSKMLLASNDSPACRDAFFESMQYLGEMMHIGDKIFALECELSGITPEEYWDDFNREMDERKNRRYAILKSVMDNMPDIPIAKVSYILPVLIEILKHVNGVDDKYAFDLTDDLYDMMYNAAGDYAEKHHIEEETTAEEFFTFRHSDIRFWKTDRDFYDKMIKETVKIFISTLEKANSLLQMRDEASIIRSLGCIMGTIEMYSQTLHLFSEAEKHGIVKPTEL